MQTRAGTPGGGQHRQCESRSGARVPSPWVSRPAPWVGPAGSPGELRAVALEGWGAVVQAWSPRAGGLAVSPGMSALLSSRSC